MLIILPTKEKNVYHSCEVAFDRREKITIEADKNYLLNIPAFVRSILLKS